jgi:SLT domain-containing protein
MKFTDSIMTQKSNPTDLFPSKSQPMPQANPKLVRRASAASTTQKQNQYITNQRRQNFSAINNNFFSQNRSPSFSVPLLIDAMNTFYQTAQLMEDEIMLPSRLKDMPVEGKIK